MAGLANLFTFLILVLVTAHVSAGVFPYMRPRNVRVPARSRPLSRPFSLMDLPGMTGGMVGGAAPGMLIMDDYGAMAPANTVGVLGVGGPNGFDSGDPYRDNGAVYY